MSNDVAYLLGTGPSLPDFDWALLPTDAYVCSVNGAGLLAPRVDAMVFCDKPDRLLADYGPAVKSELFANPSVRKVSWRTPLPKWIQSSQLVERLGGPAADREARRRRRNAMDGQKPLFYLDGLSMSFAVCWLVSEGFRRIVFVGHDLDYENKRRHFWDTREPPKNMARSALEQTLSTMRSLWPIARERGITMEAAPPSRLLEFIPCLSTPCSTTRSNTSTSTSATPPSSSRVAAAT